MKIAELIQLQSEESNNHHHETKLVTLQEAPGVEKLN